MKFNCGQDGLVCPLRKTSNYRNHDTKLKNPCHIPNREVSANFQRILKFKIGPNLVSGQSGWCSGLQSRLPTLRPGIDSWSPHVGWGLSISIWFRGFFSWYYSFPPSANLTSRQDLSRRAIKHYCLARKNGQQLPSQLTLNKVYIYLFWCTYFTF